MAVENFLSLSLGKNQLQARQLPNLSWLVGVCGRRGVVAHWLWTERGCGLNWQVTHDCSHVVLLLAAYL